MKKKQTNIKSTVHMISRKANLLMEMGEDIMDIVIKARRYKGLRKK